MTTVKDVARYVRSKNAGPFWVTIEIFCETAGAYEKIKGSKNVTPQKISELYGVEAGKVKVFYMDELHSIKFSYPRPQPQGHKYENDMHAGQQYIRIADVEI